MDSRTRLMTALNHNEPDRVPISFGGAQDSIHRIGERKLKDYYGLDGECALLDPLQQTVWPDKRLLDRFGADTVSIFPRNPSGYLLEYKDEGEFITYRDPFGTKLRRPKDYGLYFDFAEHALADYTREALEKWQMPDPKDPARIAGIREEAKKLYETTDKAIILGCPLWGIFDQIFVLRSIENAYIDLAADLDLVEMFAQKITDWYLEFWPIILSEVKDYVQIVQTGDDLGGQDGPLYSPSIFRNVFKKRHKKIIDCIKSHSNAKVYFHSCGSVFEYIPDLIDIGVDILNPVQVTAKNMDSAILKAKFGDDIAFWGGGSSTVILSQGSVGDVVAEVKRRVLDFKPGGGYVFSSIHNIQADVPPENVEAFFDTCLKYGRY